MRSVSVVIPTKDRLPLLRRAIPLYLRENQVGEVIVVVDGCSDGTLEYLQQTAAQDSRVRYVDNLMNKGLPYSRNAGNDAARFDYIFCAEDDLIITDGLFTILLTHMQETGATLISPRVVYASEQEGFQEAIRRADCLQGEPVDRRTIVARTGMAFEDDRELIMLPGPMLGRTDTFREIRYDERYRVNFWREETDFQFSAQEQGYKLISCPHVICYNISVENDRTGSHSAAGIRRVQWIVLNNWRFVKKHREFINRNFEIGNLYLYIVRFAVDRTVSEIVLPTLVSMKGRTLRNLKVFMASMISARVPWHSVSHVKKLALTLGRSQSTTTGQEEQDA